MTDHDFDSQLVAFLHGELDGTERRAVTERLRRDPDAKARLAVLDSTDLALGEALDRDAAPRRAAGPRRYVRPFLALAAALAVVAIFVFRGGGDTATVGRNDHLELRAAPKGGASAPLFTDAALELFWRNLSTCDPRVPVRLVPFAFGRTLAELGGEMDRVTHVGSFRTAVLPVVLTARITGPEGAVLEAQWAPDEDKRFDIAEERAVQTVRLRDFEVKSGTPRPAFVGKPGDREWLDDAEWSFVHMPKDKTARWFPELPGEYRVELSVQTLPAPEYSPWPTFAEPLLVSTAIVMTGEVTDWGEAHDGMRARLLWSSGARTADTTPFALQLKNESKQARKYNSIGTTMAEIPQPQHYTLIVDGEEWTQRDRIPLYITPGDLFQLHPVGKIRTFVTRPGYWRHDDKSLAQLPGSHTVQVKFHFEPSLWNAADTEIWLGKLFTPILTIDVPQPK